MDTLESVADFLEQHDFTIVTAESCTAGLVAGTLADMPGCGKWFSSGYVTYSPEAKSKILGVHKETIEKFNLTSEEVAREMAAGALRISNADIAVANTGVAGPTNGDGGIPAGTVCFAWAFRAHGDMKIISETCHFEGDRNAVRRAAADYVIDQVPSRYRAYVNGDRQAQ